MKTVSVSVANYCVPCRCRCRYCLLASCGKNTGVDQQEGMDFADRVLREIVIFTDRSDVTEEITRLRSHFSHFRSFLNNSEEALGRNMDFLMQEIFRELNTLGNKAPTTEISPLIVQLKTEVEKIREQVQNIE